MIGAYSDIGQRSSTGQKFLADFLVSEIELQTIAWGEPIICPRLSSLSFSANPTSDQISIVCITASPCKIEIVKAVPDIPSYGVVCVNSFCTQIQFGNHWKSGKI